MLLRLDSLDRSFGQAETLYICLIVEIAFLNKLTQQVNYFDELSLQMPQVFFDARAIIHMKQMHSKFDH